MLRISAWALTMLPTLLTGPRAESALLPLMTVAESIERRVLPASTQYTQCGSNSSNGDHLLRLLTCIWQLLWQWLP
jgi:hypothetical protein